MSTGESRVLLNGQELSIKDWNIDAAGVTTKYESINWSQVECTRCVERNDNFWSILEVIEMAVKGNQLDDSLFKGISQMVMNFAGMTEKDYVLYHNHVKLFRLIDGSTYNQSMSVKTLLGILGCRTKDITYQQLKQGRSSTLSSSRPSQEHPSRSPLEEIENEALDSSLESKFADGQLKEVITLGELMKLFGSTDTTDESTTLTMKTIACTAFAFLMITPRLMFKRAKTRLDYVSNSQIVATALSCFPLISEKLLKALVSAADDSALFQLLEHSGTPRVDLVNVCHFCAVINAREPFRASELQNFLQELKALRLFCLPPRGSRLWLSFRCVTVLIVKRWFLPQ